MEGCHHDGKAYALWRRTEELAIELHFSKAALIPVIIFFFTSTDDDESVRS